MKLPWKRTTWEDAIKANIALSIANAVLALFAAYALVTTLTANQRERIVLTPPVVDKTMMVGWDSANEDYLKSFGLYVATLIGNINESNAKFVADNASGFISPSVYPEVRKTILVASESRLFKEAAASTKFTPTSILYEPDTRKVFVSGTMDLLGAGTNNHSEPVTYEMEIRMVAGKPMIFQLVSYADAAPHTQKWIVDHPPAPAATTEERK